MRLILLFILFSSSFTTFAANNFEKALTAFNKNNIEEAYIHLKNVMQTEPDNLAAKILMGKVLMHKQYFGDGIDVLNEALTEGADINLFLNELGNALMIARDFQQVIDLGKGRSLSNENKLSWYLLSANAYSALENNDEARKYFALSLKMAPKSDRSLGAFAAFELQQENYAAAEDLIKQAIALYPRQSRIWHLQGQLYQSKKDNNNALVAFEEAYNINNNDPIVQRALANAYTSVGRFSDALLLVNEILINTPDDPMAKLLKSELLANTSKFEESQAVLTDISQKLSLYTDEQKNSNTTLTYVAGAAAYLQNDFELAQKELLVYLRDVPQDLAAIKMLIDIYIRQNQQDKALSLLEMKEPLIIKNLSLATKLIDLYLNNRKIYKAERLLLTLEDDFKNKPELILANVNYLTKIERFDDAIALLDKHQPKVFSPSFLLTKGLVYRANQKVFEANKIADTLLKAQPLNTDFLAFKGILLLQQQQWNKATEIFEQILVNLPDDFNSLFNLATAKAALGLFTEAKVITTKLLETQPEYIPLLILNAKLDRDTQNVSQAIETLTNITKANKTNIKATETLIEIYMQQGDFKSALSELDRISKLVFLNPVYIKQKVEIYLALKDFKQATNQIEILESLADGPRSLYELSQLYLRTNDTLKAQSTLEKALALAPENLLIKLQLIKVDLQLSSFDIAENKLNAIEKVHSKNPNVLVVRGDLLVKQNKLSLASAKYAEALSVDNNFTQALAKLYQMAAQGFGQKTFIEITTKILKNNPNDYFMRNLLADHFLNSGDTANAKFQYDILKEVDGLPNKSSVYNNLANILLKTDLALAEKYILQALELDNSSSAILDTFGWISSLQGNFEEGLIILRRAYAMNSNDPAINYHLGYTLFKLGRNEQAKKELTKALTDQDSFYEYNDAQRLLETVNDSMAITNQ
ncbi:MAG: XrtA/PEP-CTERM system TPR-repeat protein PrsT [Cognaticolwellia sp.]